ncbi:TonB-dependent receptor plug domain-containing protein [Chryseobacterium geocarposphaerae]|uniref:Iron complex outermembrane receptor protein n=1 Tax=Chryseobacterium geocarposphaerae TaxID=1416776 RepID=A0A2M9CA95_9FLAO|nr:TonB-dependent receptor [Chryseobacterium geocarposphaerae]PJJ67692.1 iron complex outermembrane receptor protein [Chryseobacterium geocarposphaerae]
MDIKRSLVLLFASYGCFLFAQEKTIDTIYVFDSQMNKVKLFHKVNTLKAEDVEKNSTNLSETLRFQSPVYIKENGRGAVSSPSFRGTTAQQTAFVWNGININSMFLGQGDINNISLSGFEQMDIKAGGGSVIYGSGAIGGSIHLNNILDFNKGIHASLFSEAGSFDTYNNFARVSFSNDKLSFKVSGNYSISQNDYEVEEVNYRNRNGQYNNSNINIAVAYKIAPHHQISWISEFFNGNQHYPVFFADIQTKTKYETQNIRSLIAWDWNTSRFTNAFKAAYTEENFQYFNNIDQPKSSGGTGKNYILKNDLNYFLSSKWNLNLITEFQVNDGEGYQSGIKKVSRNIGSVSGLVRYFATKDLRFEGGIKKDFVENISSPVLFSLSGNWKALKWYETSLNISRNFRYPTFNDLYWYPGGNENLKPETSYQFELRNQFKISDIKLSVTPYYMKIYDMIQWLPSSLGNHSPVNTDEVESYGLESQIEYAKKFGNHALKGNLGYSYSKSVNMETHKQQMYVPLHKFFGNIDYQYQFLRVYVQGMFNGLTYTDTDEKRSAAIDPYFVMNAGVSGTVLKNYTLGFKVNNIFNQVYQSTAYYYMPQRHYSINLTINF